MKCDELVPQYMLCNCRVVCGTSMFLVLGSGNRARQTYAVTPGHNTRLHNDALIFICMHLVHLLILPLRLLLCREGRHSNLLVLASKQAMEHSPLILNTFPDAQILALVNDLLASLDSDLTV